jgi:DNA-binding transcriptional regulator LsrR (DeoR family)
VHFTKNRNLHGPETRPFEIQIQSDHGKNVWTMRELDDAVANAILQMKSERGMSFAEIGKELGLAKSWVKTLHDRAVASSTVAVPIQGSF